MCESYTGFAEVYDELMDNVPYEKWCERICAAIDKYGISKRGDRKASVEEADESARLESERNLVVDLGCGTGTLTEMLYDSGFDMIGIDNSEDMLGIAMEKKQSNGRLFHSIRRDGSSSIGTTSST